MTEFPGNSHSSKKPDPPKPRVAPLIEEGAATKRKPALGRKMASTFFGADAKTAGAVVFAELVVPMIRNLLSETGTTFFQTMVHGVDGTSYYGRQTGRSAATGRQKVVYGGNVVNAPAHPAMQNDKRRLNAKAKGLHDFSEIVVDDRGKAIDILESLRELIDMYEVAKVADFYQLCNISEDYTDHNWGWTDLRDAGVVRDRHGFRIVLPKPIKLN